MTAIPVVITEIQPSSIPHCLLNGDNPMCHMPGLRFSSSGNEAHEPYAVVAPLYAGKEFGNIELNIVNEVLYQCLDHLKDACFHQNFKYKALCCAPSCEIMCMFTF